jgi:L-amino acid N-acyltransferase YncA
MEITIRDAAEGDLPGIMDIYNDAVANTTAIWNEDVVDLANRKAWFAARRERDFPVLVAVRGKQVIGYASYGDWRPFDGFRHTVEHSVYIRGEARGTGTGKRLMKALIDRASFNGIHVMVGCIEAENVASIKLHEKLGFRMVGRFSEVGIKFGRWLDLACMELRVPKR